MEAPPDSVCMAFSAAFSAFRIFSLSAALFRFFFFLSNEPVPSASYVCTGAVDVFAVNVPSLHFFTRASTSCRSRTRFTSASRLSLVTLVGSIARQPKTCEVVWSIKRAVDGVDVDDVDGDGGVHSTIYPLAPGPLVQHAVRRGFCRESRYSAIAVHNCIYLYYIININSACLHRVYGRVTLRVMVKLQRS
eukprot:SAG31_NODE_16016_length_727_cov_1.087580_2_plen_191_part_00